jgi:hypothetical protein
MQVPIHSVAEGRSKTLAVCVYGEPNIGKTVLVGTCAAMGKTLIVRPPVDHTDSITDGTVDEWVVETWSDMDDAMVYLRNEGGDKYEWVWLDSLSLMQDQLLDDIWERLIEKKPHRAEYGLDKAEYGKNMKELERWVRHMVGSPNFHFGVTCHPRQNPSTEDEDDPSDKLMPWVQGKMMPTKICGYMNVVGYMRMDKVRERRVRVMELIETDKFYARVGFPGWDTQRIVNPTMVKLVEALVETSKEAAETAKTTVSSKKTTGAATKRRPTRRTK